jgi:hypothetical protein
MYDITSDHPHSAAKRGADTAVRRPYRVSLAFSQLTTCSCQSGLNFDQAPIACWPFVITNISQETLAA